MKTYVWIITLLISLTQLVAADDGVYVLFRGVHYTPQQMVPKKEDIKGRARQDCKAPYTHYANISNESSERKTKRLQLLHEGGSIFYNGQSYPSLYDWMQQDYVNNYSNFKSNLANSDSQLRHLLRTHCQLEPDNIFLISTSLNPNTALKYAAGVCSPAEYRRFPISEYEGRKLLTNPILGFLDIFVIPAKEIGKHYPYFVVEEFACHHITIPHRFRQKNYTYAEEVNFPFLIPSRHHVHRIAVDIEQFEYPPRNPARWGNDDWMREQLSKLGNTINSEVDGYLKQQRKQRVFLGPLTHQLNQRIYHLVPLEAVNIRKGIEKKINEFGKILTPDDGVHLLEGIGVNFYAAYAIQNIAQRYPISINAEISFDSTDLGSLIPLIESPGICSVILTGPDQRGILGKLRNYEENFENYKSSIYDSVKNKLTHLWRYPDTTIWQNLIAALQRRKTPLQIYITGQSLAPEAHGELERILPRHIEFTDETHELNLQLLDYSLYQYWLSNYRGGETVDEDPDYFIKSAIHMLQESNKKNDSELPNPVDDLEDQIKDMRVSSNYS